MSAPATILLIEDDARTLDVVQGTLARERGVRVIAIDRVHEALAIAKREHPDLIVIGHEVQGNAVGGVCRAIKADPALRDAMLVMVTDPSSNDLRVAGLGLGVDEYLLRPVEPSDVLAKVRSMLRLKRAQDELRRDKVEMERLAATVRESFDHLLELLVRLVDMRIPGAGRRGERIADFALRMAERMEIPKALLHDMEIAARLHELGPMIAATDATDDDGRSGEPWQYALATRSIMREVDGLKGAAELVGGLYENWDGSGFPDHLEAGQIPLRTRVVRVLVDYFALLDAADAPSPAEAITRIERRAGTLYDPKVVACLRSVVRHAPEHEQIEQTRQLHVTSLEPGMVLADDLYSDTGLKLLARGTCLTAATIETILWRHKHDPISQPAAIERRSA